MTSLSFKLAPAGYLQRFGSAGMGDLTVGCSQFSGVSYSYVRFCFFFSCRIV